MSAPKGNKFGEGSETSGRKLVFEYPEEMQAKIEEYFNKETCPDTILIAEGIVRPIYTISGLAYHLGFESRQSFYDYEKREAFSYIVKRARLAIEMHYERNLNFNACTGSIFALKNMGWHDRTELEHSGKLEYDFTGIGEARQEAKGRLDRLFIGRGGVESLNGNGKH